MYCNVQRKITLPKDHLSPTTRTERELVKSVRGSPNKRAQLLKSGAFLAIGRMSTTSGAIDEDGALIIT